MRETISNLIGRGKYKYIERQDHIRIHEYIGDSYMVDQEVYIQVEWEDNKYFVYTVNRGAKSLKFTSEDKLYFLAYVYLYVDKLFSDESDIFDLDGKIDSLLMCKMRIIARKLLEKNLNPKYASIGKIEKDKVCLVKREKDSAVIYNGRVLAENAEFMEGYDTLLFRSKDLERFHLLFDELKQKLPVDKYYDEFLDFYVFGDEPYY